MSDDLQWIARIRALPDLRALAEAAAAPGEDPLDRMAALRDEHVARGETYVWTTAYRRPPSRCHSGEHEIAALNREVVKPGGGALARLLVSELALHDVEHHGRKWQPDQLRKLQAIFS